MLVPRLWLSHLPLLLLLIISLSWGFQVIPNLNLNTYYLFTALLEVSPLFVYSLLFFMNALRRSHCSDTYTSSRIRVISLRNVTNRKRRLPSRGLHKIIRLFLSLFPPADCADNFQDMYEFIQRLLDWKKIVLRFGVRGKHQEYQEHFLIW